MSIKRPNLFIIIANAIPLGRFLRPCTGAILVALALGLHHTLAKIVRVTQFTLESDFVTFVVEDFVTISGIRNG